MCRYSNRLDGAKMAMNNVLLTTGRSAAGAFALKAAGSILLTNRAIPDQIATSLKYIPITAIAAVVTPSSLARRNMDGRFGPAKKSSAC